MSVAIQGDEAASSEARSFAPFEPPFVPPQHVLILNAFHRRLRPFKASLAGLEAEISVVTVSPPANDRTIVSFSVDGRPGELILPTALATRLLKRVDASLALSALPPEDAALVLEFALQDAIGALEAILDGRRIEFRSTARIHPEAVDQPLLTFQAALPEQPPFAVGLRPAPGDASALIAALWRRLRLPDPDYGLRFAARFRFAAATVTRADLEDLQPGDIILAEDSVAPGRALVVIAERLAAEVELAAQEARLTTGVAPLSGSQWKWCLDMPDQSSSPERDKAADIGALPVRLVFEFGQLELSLEEIQALGPGAVLPLTRPVEEALDIVANGRRIGRGSLVRVGDSIGVRVTRLFADG